MAETDEGARPRRFLRPRLVVPAGLAALLLVGGSVWAVSGGEGGPTAPVGAGAATPSVTVTAEPSATPTPEPTEAQPSPSPSAVPEPAPAPASASVEPEAEEPGSSAPTAARKPTAKAEATPASKPQGAPAGKPKAPAAQDPHNLAPTACTDCHSNPQEPDPQHTCIHDAAGRLITCSPVQTGIPILRPGQSMGTPTPGWPDHTH
ncbi:hypothetical protein ACIRRH_02940 [Kitasatospora sp. NPDC101235]|uniref:hypothetical protein n=1 Tax=Kitasatospora sp. NPDC101235 TaxID=3364101 RepID=UPI003801990C